MLLEKKEREIEGSYFFPFFDLETQNLKVRSITETVLDK